MYGVAGVVGLMMAKIMGLPQKSLRPAQLFGECMQYLNIIRDVNEDFKNNRIYLPRTDFENFNVALDLNLKGGQSGFQKLIRFQLDRFYTMFNQAASGFKYIPKKYLRSIKTSADIYLWTANKIYIEPNALLSKKLRPSQLQVLSYLVKNILVA